MTVINPPPVKIPVRLQEDRVVGGFFQELTRSLYQLWFANGGPGTGVIPPTLTDTEAANGTLYYSSTSSKLTFKDSSGTPNALY